MSKTVIYDACVLYPASLRSFLMWLGVHELVRPRWTERILDECFDNLLENRSDLEPEHLERTRRLMCEAIPDCLVSGFESRIGVLSLPDPDDRHVLAAALEVDADFIATFNLRDFPDERLSAWCRGHRPRRFCFSVRRQRPGNHPTMSRGRSLDPKQSRPKCR